MPRHIATFTGISQQMIDGAPHVMQVFPDLVDFIGQDPVIAHNGAFDEAIVASECERLGLNHYPRNFICTVKVARYLFPELRTHALGALAYRLGLQFTPGAHRAGTDAEVTAAVLLALIKTVSERYPTTPLTVDTLRRLAHGLDLESSYVSAA
jgi:DNA polymerase-3 subunit epsilon